MLQLKDISCSKLLQAREKKKKNKAAITIQKWWRITLQHRNDNSLPQPARENANYYE